MHCVGSSPHQDAELIPSVERLLLDGQDHRTQVLVAGEVVPVLGAVEVLLVSLLLHGDQLEGALLVPLLLDGGLLAGTAGII